MIFLFGTLLIVVLQGTSVWCLSLLLDMRFMEQSVEVTGDFLRKQTEMLPLQRTASAFPPRSRQQCWDPFKKSC